MLRRVLLLSVACSAALTAPSAADTITLVGGKTLANVQVVSEGLLQVTYKDGKEDKTVPAETVQAIDYEKKPAALTEAEGFLLTDDAESAIDTLDAYVASVIEKPSAAGAFKWAPAAAAWRAVEVRQILADVEGARSASARVIQSFSDSRFVPQAYLAKAEAELEMGQAAQAQKTLGDLSGLIGSKSLPPRWALECRLAQARADDKLKPDSQRNQFELVARDAAGEPAVLAHARLLLGESWLAEAGRERGSAKDLRAKAQAEFQKVIDGDGATRASLAGAYAGLGECLFLQGADVDDKALLQEASLNFLRVLTLYRDQGQAAARSLFYAMRCFDLLPDPRRKAEMKRELLALYGQSPWAEKAKNF